MSRLSTIVPELAASLERVTPSARRQVSLVAADFALSASGLDDPKVLREFGRLRVGEPLAPDTERWLAELVQELDDAAWQLQDQVDAGMASADDYVQAFGRARAVAAVSYAATGDSLEAALEAAYEASATTDDPAPLWALIRAELATA